MTNTELNEQASETKDVTVSNLIKMQKKLIGVFGLVDKTQGN